MIVSKTFIPVPGLTYFSAAEIYGVNMLMCAREGHVDTEIPTGMVDPEPFNDEFTHSGSVLTFASAIPFIDGEKLVCIWQE